jgi:hypothetical protein
LSSINCLSEDKADNFGRAVDSVHMAEGTAGSNSNLEVDTKHFDWNADADPMGGRVVG